MFWSAQDILDVIDEAEQIESEESSEYEEYSDSEDETGPRLKPVFVRKWATIIIHVIGKNGYKKIM
jgi:microfibrillar-associated protein 1